MIEVRWREMRREDLRAVIEIAEVVHPAYPERPEIFAERLALAPGFCLVLEENASIAGYMIAHPWTIAAPPALDTLLAQLPEAPDTVQLHDLAIAPAAQGRGLSAPALERLETRARTQVSRIDLVAVSGKEAFWARRGFEPLPDVAVSPALATYGDGAVRMIRLLAR
ncbi:GNAT family N-acetyltransferase [Salinarimonas ramus]|uniref:N-acetyltransferase n=1 Tax=Salinarimonas ramus TaxID=690164 RepID=A0A917Q3V8_9HYPH|nr:GNAT family N-acetyltransferase [Salinarimonas ramus]GGK17846.1 N-acetyltransferase [Salinarimonas ramus]